MPVGHRPLTVAMPPLDHSHDSAIMSWLPTANGHADFPLQNLPLGIFSTADDATPRGGVAVGDFVLDLAAADRAGVFSGEAGRAAALAAGPTLNALMAAGAALRRALRRRVFALLTDGADEQRLVEPLLRHSADCTMHLPATIGDYTDFYAGIHHATNVGRVFRPDAPLPVNYKWVPIGYHGRSSSIVVSGTSVQRPQGQRKGANESHPLFGPSQRLDFEIELGIWIGPGNELGTPIQIGHADEHVAGFCLLNDWSARDVQAWEYQPLGPFLAKNFVTSISPWVVTPEALAPFYAPQVPHAPGDPAPLDYLSDADDQAHGAIDVEFEVLLHTPSMKERGFPPHRLSVVSSRHLYWTVAQLITHHTSNGCNLRPGDLLGSGTISAPTGDGLGCLLEITEGGTRPIALPPGELRQFLEDGDEVIIRARARRSGYTSIGFGEVRGTVQPSRSLSRNAMST